MGIDAAAFRVAQFVLQGLGKDFYAGLRNVVGGIARWRGDALLRAGVDDQAGASARHHPGSKHLRAVDDAPEIDAKNALPIVFGAEHLAAGLNAGIVHQNVGAAKTLLHRAFQRDDILAPADVDSHRHDAGLATRRDRREGFGGLGEAVSADIGNADLHAKACKAHCGGKPNARRATGDDGCMI